MFTKIKQNKKTILACLICSLIVGIAGVSATTLLYSKDVTYDNSSSGLSATTVQDALDELYEKAKSAPSCDENGTCTVTCPRDKPNYVATSTGYSCKFGFTTNEIIEKDLTVGGLYADSTEAVRYFYSGKDPNNKIVFNGEPYRILAIEKDKRIKIIKIVSIGTYAWNTSGTNTWSSASLNTYLKNTWLPTQESGEDYQYLSTSNVWYVGGTTPDNVTIETSYTYEKKTTISSSIGLVSTSDFLKSKYIGSTFLLYSSSWWTISRNANSSSMVYVVSSSGLGSGSANDARKVFPVLYLKSTVSLTGSGTSTDPYCISGSSCPTDLNFTQRAS